MTKYIELPLPNGAGGMAAAHYMSTLREHIDMWIAGRPIVYTLTVNRKRYIAELRFIDDNHYSLFALSWPIEGIWRGYKLVK